MPHEWFRTVNLLQLLRLAVAVSVLQMPLGNAGPVSPAPGCQLDRRTVTHSGGVELASGNHIPCLVDTGIKSGEVSLAIAKDGTLLQSVAMYPAAIAVSSDEGATWEKRLLPKSASLLAAEGYLDPITDRYFFVGGGNRPVFGSDDKGLTWSTATFDSRKRQDWPKLFSGPPVSPRSSGYPTNTYYCNWTTPLGIFSQTRCFKSTDGGLAFTATGADPYANAICNKPKQTPGVGHGRGIVDPRDGTIYLPVSFCSSMEIAVSRDEGATWHRQTIRPNIFSAEKALGDAKNSPQWNEQLSNYSFNLAPELVSSEQSDALAIDGNGNLYAVWISGETYLPVTAHSSDGGQHWSEPIVVSPPDVVQAVFPSITVTANGKVGIAYYGTTDKWNWTGYLTLTTDALIADPTFESATVTYPNQPLMSEPCCWASGLQDYTTARWAADGSLWSAFAGYTGTFFYAHGMAGRLLPQ